MDLSVVGRPRPPQAALTQLKHHTKCRWTEHEGSANSAHSFENAIMIRFSDHVLSTRREDRRIHERGYSQAVCGGSGLWRAVRAADRAPRARPARLLGDRALRHPRRRARRDGPLRAHPLRRPRERVRRGRAQDRPRHPRAGPAGAGLLLRPPDHGRHARRRGRPLRGGRVRPGRHQARRRFRAVRGHARRADGVDEPSRRGEPRARGGSSSPPRPTCAPWPRWSVLLASCTPRSSTPRCATPSAAARCW